MEEEARERTSCTSFVRCNDMWLAKDNRFLNPMSTYERNLMAPTCLIINFYSNPHILGVKSRRRRIRRDDLGFPGNGVQIIKDIPSDKLRIPWKKIGSNAVLRDCRTWNDKEEKLLESHAFIVHNILLQDLFLYPILGTRNALAAKRQVSSVYQVRNSKICGS